MAKKIKPLTGNHGDFSGIVLKAATSGNAEAVRHYLDVNPGWLNQEGPHGRTLLWEAAYKGRTALVAELIERGAEVNVKGSYYTPMLVELSPLSCAEEAGRTELADLLVANGAQDDLYAACYRGDLETIDALLAQDPESVNRPSRSDAEPHPRMGWNPIHYAVVGGRLGAVKLLVDSGAEIGDHRQLLIDWAQENREIIRYLKSINAEAKSPTSQAPKQEPGIPAIDRPDWMGYPVLVDACRGNHNAPDDPQRVQKLLDRDANVNIKDYKQKTPLHRASQAGFLKITNLLLDHGADLDAVDEKGQTPIFDAAYHGRAETVTLLVERGADVNHADHRGETPLFAAVQRGWQEAVDVLLVAGANVQHTNDRGKKAVDVIRVAGARPSEKELIRKQLKKLSS
ncbi:MAG: ankyrin repeat domain-containing protein [Verrucomicrobiota bacterium]